MSETLFPKIQKLVGFKQPVWMWKEGDVLVSAWASSGAVAKRAGELPLVLEFRAAEGEPLLAFDLADDSNGSFAPDTHRIIMRTFPAEGPTQGEFLIDGWRLVWLEGCPSPFPISIEVRAYYQGSPDRYRPKTYYFTIAVKDPPAEAGGEPIEEPPGELEEAESGEN